MAMPLEISNPKRLSDAYKAARRTDELSLATLCDFWRSSQVEEPIDDKNYTILHFIAFHGNSDAIRRLRNEKLLTTEQLICMCDANGDTALHVAARFGHLSVVQDILDGEENSGTLISLPNHSEDTPIYTAAASGKEKVVFFLMKEVPCEHVTEMKRKDESTILHAAIEGQYFELAFRILKAYPQLAHRPDKRGITPLYLLACNKSSFRSATIYNIKNLSSSPFIPWRIISILIYWLYHYTPVHDRNPENDSVGSHILAVFFAGYRSIIKVLPLSKHTCEARERHEYANAVASKIVKDLQNWPCTQPSEVSSTDPLIRAIRNNIMELVKLILEKFPKAATVVDEKGRNILHVAAEIKDPFMYEYLKTHVSDGEKLLSDVDRYGNTVLHLAAGHTEFPKTAHSPLYGMAWEVFWYKNLGITFTPTDELEISVKHYLKHVKGDTPGHLIPHRNSVRLTAKEVFTKTHIGDPKDEEENTKKALEKDDQGNTKKALANDTTLVVIEALENAKKGKETVLIKEAEKEAMTVNEGLMIVSILISTINFAAIFTIPGGFSEHNGIPLFFQQKPSPESKELDFFLKYIGVSLLSSLIALGAQLSIQLSRFRKIDFYYILPMKIFIATTALYYSTTFAITAGFQVYILEEAVGNYAVFGMITACFTAALVYFDLVYYIMNNLYFPIRYKFFGP